MPPHMGAVGRCSQVRAKARGGASKHEVTLVNQKPGEKQKKSHNNDSVEAPLIQNWQDKSVLC